MTDDTILKLDEYWPYQVTVLANLVAKHTTSVLKAHGDLNLSQWRVLAAVAEQEGRTAAEIVTVTPMDKGIVSRATASLVEDGLVQKVNDKDDKRRSRLYMTAKGKVSYQAILNDLTRQTGALHTPSEFNSQILDVISNMKKV